MRNEKTILYEIVNPLHKDRNEFGECRIIDSVESSIDQPIPTSAIQDGTRLAYVLNHIDVKDNEEVLFVTWDHGFAFGVFKQATVALPQTREPIDDELEFKKFPYLKKFWKKALATDDFESFVKTRPASGYQVVQSGRDVFRFAITNDTGKLFKQVLSNEEMKNIVKVQKEDNVSKKLYFSKSEYIALNTEGIPIPPPLFDLPGPGVSDRIEVELEETDAPEILKNGELTGAFKLWLKKKQVGVLLMMNCWMLNLHTLYAMRNGIQYLVAPQGDIGVPGYNCRDIIRYINSKQGARGSNRELAGELCCVQ